MKAFIKANSDGFPYNVDTFNAYQGFKELGFDCLFFNKYEDLIEACHKPEDPIIGDDEILKKRLNEFNIKYISIDFPAEIGMFLGRIIWATDIQTIRRRSELHPVFVKSLEDKRLSGRVVRNSGDLDDCVSNSDHFKVLCSHLINFISEWRVFVRYENILDVRPYKGDWKVHCDPSVIKDAVQTYTSAPCAYSLDFGVTDEGETLLININEGLTSESYGLNPKVYAEFLFTRWAELSQTSDSLINKNALV